MPKDYFFVSCDIVAHSAERNLDVQIERVVGINRLVSDILRAAPAAGMIWASGGDGGHLAFPAGTSSQLVTDYIFSLREWSMRKKVRLRVSCHHGPAECIDGAGNRTDLVGAGINFAGSLIRLGSEASVLATTGFRQSVVAEKATTFTFHDVRMLEAKNFAPEEVWLLSAEGRFKSEWCEPIVLSDRAALQAATERGEALEIIYRAGRLLESNPADASAIGALQDMAVKKLRLAARDSFINDVFMDAQFGPDVIRAGTLVERRAGETICEHNDEGQTMFLILRGAIEVCLPRNDAAAAPPPTGRIILPPGELTGELAFGLRRKRTATLRCAEKSALLSLSYTKILKASEEQNLRDQLKGILDRKIRDRIVQYVWTSAPYFRAACDPTSPALHSAPWLPLLGDCALVTVDWNKERKINQGHSAFAERGICVLVSGRLEATIRKSVLDGVDCPLLFVNLPDDVNDFRSGYKLLDEEVKLLTISQKGLLGLDPDTYQKVVEGISNYLEKYAVPSPVEKKPPLNENEKPNMKKHLFLSYCRDNQDEVARLRGDLLAAGETVWWMKDILPGQDWKQEIRRAMKNAYAVVVCLSRELDERSQSGVNPEIYDAITAYRQQATGSIFLIPVRLSDCEIPDIEISDTRTLDSIQFTDVFPEDKRAAGVQQLLAALRLTSGHP